MRRQSGGLSRSIRSSYAAQDNARRSRVWRKKRATRSGSGRNLKPPQVRRTNSGHRNRSCSLRLAGAYNSLSQLALTAPSERELWTQRPPWELVLRCALGKRIEQAAENGIRSPQLALSFACFTAVIPSTPRRRRQRRRNCTGRGPERRGRHCCRSASPAHRR